MKNAIVKYVTMEINVRYHATAQQSTANFSLEVVSAWKTAIPKVVLVILNIDFATHSYVLDVQSFVET